MIGFANGDTYGSRHWVSASRPDDAVTAGGQPRVSSGSTSATRASIEGCRMLTLTPCSGELTTPFMVTSEPVPAVVGTAMNGSGVRAGGRPAPITST